MKQTAQILLLLAVSTPLATPTLAQSKNAQPVRYGTWGVDLSTRDLSVKPGDDFERYAAGRWIDSNEIPADQAQTSVGYDLYNRTQDRLREIITGAPKDSALGAFYASYIDEARLEQLDDKPLRADLAKLDAVSTKSAFTRFMAETLSDFGGTVFGVGILPNPDDSRVNILYVETSGMGLPDKDYYLLDQHKRQRDAYRAYVERTLKMTGTPNPAATADSVLKFETEIAKLSWDKTDLRDFTKLNNQMSPAELARYAPGVDWANYLKTAKVDGVPKLMVADNTAVKALAALYDRTPLSVLKNWQRFKIADQASPFLSKRFVDSRFEFTKTLSGVQQLRPRWRRGIDQVDDRLGDLVGKTYVERYFSPQSKSEMERLVGNLKKAAAQRIRGNGWMSQATKTEALAKLDNMQVMVGYPDKFRDYSALQLKADDLYGNVKQSTRLDWAYAMEDLGKPVDRKKWSLSPATVNAYNSFLQNKIVFPAGILQAPLFDLSADPAVNYGAIGAVIGHEIMHGFDDKGAKFDSAGKLRNWWTAEDLAKFKALTSELGKQYSSYEAAPGTFINGDFTMGENIGDMSGLEVAYEAYKVSLNGKAAPVLDGLTGDQRFFLAFAQAWRGKAREDAIKTQVASDPHSPERFRIIGPLRNLDAWYQAFGIGPDSKFYLPPEKRVRIW
ncbi:M13 family metallopeptidase [Sphingomonas piscis]|uniref:M13 family metallopeptidase n=1 Tax=Sphingomonas piscis TaxID=2714943 RepID=A0A6G7YLX5_9SPHN|nr:M13 family metallopeptidase [Sphingomonas piscis]QIK77750.1 M13 family metallopeptidase [Sphingomonas piscis]